MDVDIAGSREGEFVCDSNEALLFKLVRCEEDIDDEEVFFRPEMSHQIFGQSESIYGYKDLEVKLYYSACRLTMYFGLEYSSIVDPKTSEGIEPDNVLKVLQEKLQVPNILTNIDDFVKSLQDEDSFQPFGEKLSAFTLEKNTGNVNYEIYHCDTSNQKFLNFHERLQTFILFFIDAASFIDVDDSKWQFFVVYEKLKNKNGKECYAVAGYCTVYEYYAYPDRMRPRVSQMLVLPPFQRSGLGARLLCTVYQHYRNNPAVTDITVEDPNEEFKQLRDYVDSCLCSNLDSFSLEKLKEGFTAAMASQACEKYKINKKQARRVYEILRLKDTNVHDKKEYAAFRIDIKKRLNQPFQKETLFLKKLKPLLEKNPQMTASLGLKTQEQRFETLENMFAETEKEYNSIIASIQKHPLAFSI